jgi:hypothetical protein
MLLTWAPWAYGVSGATDPTFNLGWVLLWEGDYV